MTLSRENLFKLFKYAVYALLTLNIFVFGREEFLAAQLQFSNGLDFGDIIEAYAATIDTAAWVVLLLMFELETSVLDDEQITPALSLTLLGVRGVCYAFIIYAFYGYIANLMFVYDISPLAIGNTLCGLAAENWSYAIDLDEYVALSAENCNAIGSNNGLVQFGALSIVVDQTGLMEIQRLAWTDVINAGVWILVVLILEIDVLLQERKRLEGLILKSSNALKFVLYSILLLAAIYWGIKGDFIDFWDAFLWLLAFFFIELNVIEWRHEVAESNV